MSHGRPASLFAALITLLATACFADEPPWIGGEATRTRITIVGVDGSSPKVVLDSPRRFAAPEWTPDGAGLIVNGGGKLWRMPATGGVPSMIPIHSTWIDINHALSPDGKRVAFNAYPIWTVPIEGGEPTRVTAESGNNLHAWSPDGKRVAYSSNRGKSLDLFSIGVDGLDERRLTTNPGKDDAPAYTPDGRWVYFLSDRSGNWDIWRIPAEGGGPNDSKAERITDDDRDDALPRVSPDGQWLIYTSYLPRAGLNGVDRDILIRRVPLLGLKPGTTRPEDVVRIVGGHGTLGARAFSPDGKRFVYASFEPPSPTIRLVLFTPSDREPPATVPHRLTQIADAAEKFLFEEMTRYNYAPAVSKLFRRNPDGTVEITYVKGDRPASDPSYLKATCRDEAIEKAKQRLRIEGDGHVWWTYLYLGDRPTRFGEWVGGGCARDGGWSIVNYDTIPGEVRPDLNLGMGFNADIFLKGTIHELGHAFGLPHIGPDLSLKRGNSLMGANNSVYAERKYSNADQVYLTEASAAMLWKHPVFSGSIQDRRRQPSVKLVDFKPTFSRTANRITLAGKLVSDIPAHSVIVLDDLGKPEDEYWYRSHVARIALDGTFKVLIDRPARANGHFRIMFCFDNGAVTGDGAGVVYGDRGEIRKSYRIREGTYTFGN
jgi:Tol biopolymer transport system component